jgi:hypothetical protein
VPARTRREERARLIRRLGVFAAVAGMLAAIFATVAGTGPATASVTAAKPTPVILWDGAAHHAQRPNRIENMGKDSGGRKERLSTIRWAQWNQVNGVGHGIVHVGDHSYRADLRAAHVVQQLGLRFFKDLRVDYRDRNGLHQVEFWTVSARSGFYRQVETSPSAVATAAHRQGSDCDFPKVSIEKHWTPPNTVRPGSWHIDAQGSTHCFTKPQRISMITHIQQRVKRPAPGFFYIARSRRSTGLDEHMNIDAFKLNKCITGRFRGVVSAWGTSSTGENIPVEYWCTAPIRIADCTTPPGVPRAVRVHPDSHRCRPGPDPVHE